MNRIESLINTVSPAEDKELVQRPSVASNKVSADANTQNDLRRSLESLKKNGSKFDNKKHSVPLDAGPRNSVGLLQSS